MDLKWMVFTPGLFQAGKELAQSLLHWEFRMTRFSSQFGMDIPDLLKCLVVMGNAPQELQSHICLTMGHKTPYLKLRDAIVQLMQNKTALSGLSNANAMDVDEIMASEDDDITEDQINALSKF